MNDNAQRLNNCITLSNRQNLKITGVTDVGAFNDEEIRLTTEYGDLLIKGASLHIEALDLTTSDMEINGEITALVYSSVSTKKGIFKRLL